MKSLEDVKPGDSLGRYELLAKVAEGGMAAVWAARLTGTRGFQRLVAIKTILPALLHDPAFEQMFLDEATLASRVQHPHVAQILDLGEQDGVLYLVMEWVDGEPLSILQKASLRLTGKPVPLPIATRIVMQAAAGLHAAHELRDEDGTPLGLVHRDVSPQNILVSYRGSVKVVDFGIAKAMGRGTAEAMAGKIKGKVPYMSPEQAQGEEIDRRTDVFALGTVFYQLALGRHPFRGESDAETMNNLLSRPVAPPRAIDPSFPEEIENVILTAIAKNKDERFPTMAAFEAALGAAVARLGMLTSDDEVAAFVEKVLGERAKKRRESLKEAMRAADENAALVRESTPSLESVTPSFARREVAFPELPHAGLSLAPQTMLEAPADSGLELELEALPPQPRTRTVTQASFVRATREEQPKSSNKGIAIFVSLAAAALIGAAAFGYLRANLAGAEEATTGLEIEAAPLPVDQIPTLEELKAASAAAAAAPAASAVEPAEDVEIVEEGERVLDEPLPTFPASTRKTSTTPTKKKDAAQATEEQKPAPPAPKRKKVPEIQDPGF